MEEIEIHTSERWPADTLMELPEMSYAQELLNTPVPFGNYVEFLSDYVKPASVLQSTAAIASYLEITTRQVQWYAAQVNAEYDEVSETYPLYTREVIEEELVWDETFKELDDFISSKTISHYLVRSVRWVERTAYELGVYPQPQVLSSGRTALAYPKEVVRMLRTVMLHAPPANGSYGMSELEKLTGRDRTWIDRRIHDNGIETFLRMSAGNGSIVPHVNEEAVDVLVRLAKEQAPGGEYLTVSLMADRLNRDAKWVIARLDPYLEQGKQMLDDGHRLTTHYPPTVFEALRQLSEANNNVPLAEEKLPIKALAARLGRSVLWVRNRLDLIEEYGETRKTAQGREYRYYGEEVFAILEASESRQSRN